MTMTTPRTGSGGALRRMLPPTRAGGGSRNSESTTADGGRTAFEADVDRLAFDGHTRLLGDKTQVHRAGGGTAARSRLSHSLEVSRVGRTIGAAFVAGTAEARADPALSRDVQDVLQAAGIAHDLGHPPFGHRGEEAISAFFRDHPAGRAALRAAGGTRDDEPARHGAEREFTEFDGNAQAMRHVLRLGGWHPEHGLRLTAATICAAAKYPWTGSRDGAKRSVYTTDADRFATAAAACGMTATGIESWTRHPLSYLCEAADDLTYAIVDIEDAAMLGVIGHDEAETLLSGIVHHGPPGDAPSPGRWAPGRRLAYLRSQAISELVAQAGATARKHREAIMAGGLGMRLTQAMPAAGALEAIAAFSAARIYGSANTRADEAAWAIGTVMAEAASRPTKDGGTPCPGGPDGPAHRLCDLVASLTDGSCSALAREIDDLEDDPRLATSRPGRRPAHACEAPIPRPDHPGQIRRRNMA